MKFSEMPYKRPDLDAIEREYARITEEFEKADSAEKQYELILEHEKLTCDFDTMSTIAYIHNSINTTDPFYEKEMAFFDANNPVMNSWRQKFYEAVNRSAFKEKLAERTGQLFFTNIALSLKSFSDKTTELQKRENALVTEYEKLLASAKIDFHGETLNLSEIQKYTISPDREVRREAWTKAAEFFSENSKRLDEIFDELVKNRTEQAHRLGYENYVQLGYDRLGRNCYGPREVAEYREQIVHELVPIITDIKKKQAQRLGLSALKFWDNDCIFPDGNPKPQGSTKELVDAAERMYNEMSPLTGEFFRFMRENELFDLESKKGKAGGGYCTSIPGYKAPFIFSNFNGTAGDVEVLTHEAGHALADYVSRDMVIAETRTPTMDAAETHSMSMELFSRPWDPLFFGDDTEKFHRYQLEVALDFIPYGCLVDHFQTAVYEHPEMTPDERKQTWLKLEHTYRPWIDFEGIPYFCEGGGYQRQHHIYSFPLYYIDYCLAQTTALEFWSASEKDWKEAFTRYLDFVKAGGTKTYVELVNDAGLQLPFQRGCIRKISEEVCRFIDSGKA
ncbi:MAG: M3 family oligoendopeptidase [Thermocaproicibacter melissae]|jgi:M3 family oligoendopeptidase|uniref:M3 family oligoendopeptidase n=1 Tax=Thermocaproicibacter melissae TaxID=2966552 RepID=UPI0024B23383|nr:M3 family oligoendopeptidase [Thermocaproicibacter melissae]WBY63571.1 M3 family oligoendopeptidase [Thermocaproicibacter melissae]